MAGKKQNFIALVATLAVTAAAKKVADQVWRIGSGGKDAPTDPADPDIDLRQAMLFAVISGAAMSVARTALARRMARSERREARARSAASG